MTMISIKNLILEAIKDYKNIQSIATFKKGVAGDKYNPLSPEEKKAATQIMLSPKASEDQKEKVKDKFVNSHLRLLPTLYSEMNAENFGFDFDEFVSLAYQAIKRSINKFNWNATNTFGAYMRQAIRNELTTVGQKRQKEKNKTGQLDSPKYGDEDDKLTVADTIEAGPDYYYFMEDPAFEERVKELRDTLTGDKDALKAKRFILDLLTLPKYRDLNFSQNNKAIMRAFGDMYSIKFDESGAKWNGYVKDVLKLLASDPTIQQIAKD